MKKKEMIHRVIHNKQLLAIIIKAGKSKKGVIFYSPEDAPLQVGNVTKKRGDTIMPHMHKEPIKTVRITQEVLYIEKGKLRADIYSSDGKLTYQTILEKGDKIFLASGGHGFEILEDTIIFEVKQGPYPGYEKAKHYLKK